MKNMAKKLSKRQIKIIAAMHSAIHLSSIDDFMFDDNCDVTENERQEIINEINLLADKISLGQPLNIGSTAGIIKYVRDKF